MRASTGMVLARAEIFETEMAEIHFSFRDESGLFRERAGQLPFSPENKKPVHIRRPARLYSAFPFF